MLISIEAEKFHKHKKTFQILKEETAKAIGKVLIKTQILYIFTTK